MRRPGIFAPPGTPTDLNLMLAWRPGAVTCYHQHLQANALFDYKAKYPDAKIIVRFQHPRFWHRDPVKSAIDFGHHIANAWPEIQALHPYVCFANELNLFYQNGERNPRNQRKYESEQFYQQIGQWVAQTAQTIKDNVPDMQLITPPFSPGRHEDGLPDENGQIRESFAGYDYLADAVRTWFDNRLAVHAWWGDNRGSRPDRLYDADVSSWYAFRWRRLLKMFAARYGISARIVIDEAGNYAASDADFFEQLTYFSQQTLSNPQVLALSFYAWQDRVARRSDLRNLWVRNIQNLPEFTARLAALANIPLDPLLVQESTGTKSSPIDVKPKPETPKFGGPLIRIGFEDGHIESMPLETYLRAVVPAEMPALWHSEALKAQAIAARTYALKSIQRARYGDRPIDISSSYKTGQEYNPQRIHPAADAAILATKGIVLRYRGSIIEALYSANCGGYTKNNEDVFGTNRQPIAYLRRVRCPVRGQKYGHGVGLCQYGAKQLAEEGQNFRQILAHYYKGTTLDRISD